MIIAHICAQSQVLFYGFMIRFNLSKLLDKLEAKEGKKITLKELSERSGCDRNVLSRIQNRPDIIPSANVIDKLVQFFFFEISRDGSKPHLDRNRMRSVIKDFVSVFPDDEEFWIGIPSSFRDNPTISLTELWQLYTQRKTPVKVETAKLSDAKAVSLVQSSLKDKLLDAQQSRQEGLDIDISLSADEFDLLRAQLPSEFGGTKE